MRLKLRWEVTTKVFGMYSIIRVVALRRVQVDSFVVATMRVVDTVAELVVRVGVVWPSRRTQEPLTRRILPDRLQLVSEPCDFECRRDRRIDRASDRPKAKDVFDIYYIKAFLQVGRTQEPLTRRILPDRLQLVSEPCDFECRRDRRIDRASDRPKAKDVFDIYYLKAFLQVGLDQGQIEVGLDQGHDLPLLQLRWLQDPDRCEGACVRACVREEACVCARMVG